MPFRLIEKLQPEMRAELEWTQRQVKLGHSLMNLRHGGAPHISEIGNGKFYGRDCRDGGRRSELAVREEVPTVFVELDTIVRKLGEQLTLAHASQANCPGYRVTVGVDHELKAAVRRMSDTSPAR